MEGQGKELKMRVIIGRDRERKGRQKDGKAIYNEELEK